jgi:hypothetical protein
VGGGGWSVMEDGGVTYFPPQNTYNLLRMSL